MDYEKALETMAENVTRLTNAVGAMQANSGLRVKGGLVTKTPANWMTATPLHGVGGIFSGPGLEREVVTAHVRPFGIAADLPSIASVSVDPRFASLTGYTATTGDQPAHVCLDAPHGYMKSCILTARFGTVRMDTNTIDIDDVRLRVNRGDFSDLILKGRVLGLANLEPSGLDEGKILDIITMSEMVTAAINTERLLNVWTWQGSFGVGNQFPGLDAQIATGIVDAETNALCPALDSDVKNYNFALMSNTIVDQLSALEYYLTFNAMTMGLTPVKWVIAMRPNMFYELTEIWPCAYNTGRCATAVRGTSSVVIDGRDNIAERDAMRAGKYLDINGNRYDVVLDTGIFEHNSTNTAGIPAGDFASSIYFVPLTILGSMPVTYWEYVDFSAGRTDTQYLHGTEPFWWTDGGLYSWAIEYVKWCYKLSLKSSRRLVLRTPQLAGRLDDIRIRPTQHTREPDPASPYFQDGGSSLRPDNTAFYSVWSSR